MYLRLSLPVLFGSTPNPVPYTRRISFAQGLSPSPLLPRPFTWCGLVPEEIGPWFFLFCFESVIYNPLHAARRAMAAAVPLPLAGQRRGFI